MIPICGSCQIGYLLLCKRFNPRRRRMQRFSPRSPRISWRCRCSHLNSHFSLPFFPNQARLREGLKAQVFLLREAGNLLVALIPAAIYAWLSSSEDNVCRFWGLLRHVLSYRTGKRHWAARLFGKILCISEMIADQVFWNGVYKIILTLDVNAY